MVEECARLETRDPRRSWARAEALARGWRELDREDVTEEIKLVDVLIGNVAIGCVEYSHPKRWTWTHWSPEFDVIGRGARETKEEAQGQLIAAENARRAKEWRVEQRIEQLSRVIPAWLPRKLAEMSRTLGETGTALQSLREPDAALTVENGNG